MFKIRSKNEHVKSLKKKITYICQIPLRALALENSCGGVKPRPTIKAQEHRFIKSTPEEEKSLGHHVGNTGA